MTTSAQLLAGNGDLWDALVSHPFVADTAHGVLPRETFGRWLAEDHFYVAEFRRFLAVLAAQAPTEPARDLLAGALGPLRSELDLFRREAGERGIRLAGEPGPTTLGYSAYLHACALDGYAAGLTALYAAEKAYFDAWSAVRARAERGSPYWPFIDNWSSAAFGQWVADVGALLDAEPLSDGLRRTFRRVARFELRFWDAVYAGEQWRDGRASPDAR